MLARSPSAPTYSSACGRPSKVAASSITMTPSTMPAPQAIGAGIAGATWVRSSRTASAQPPLSPPLPLRTRPTRRHRRLTGCQNAFTSYPIISLPRGPGGTSRRELALGARRRRAKIFRPSAAAWHLPVRRESERASSAPRAERRASPSPHRPSRWGEGRGEGQVRALTLDRILLRSSPNQQCRPHAPPPLTLPLSHSKEVQKHSFG